MLWIGEEVFRRVRLDDLPSIHEDDAVGHFPGKSHQQRVPGPHGFTVRNNIVRLRAADRSRAEARAAITFRARRCRVHRIPPQRP
jgi:hypothetical protein